MSKMQKRVLLPKSKNGSNIHIKKSHEGNFTDYCGGKVTDECIQKGKSSHNPKIRKMATFAQNARKWKHLDGGKVQYALFGDKIAKVVASVQNVLGNKYVQGGFDTAEAVLGAVKGNKNERNDLKTKELDAQRMAAAAAQSIDYIDQSRIAELNQNAQDLEKLYDSQQQTQQTKQKNGFSLANVLGTLKTINQQYKDSEYLTNKIETQQNNDIAGLNKVTLDQPGRIGKNVTFGKV